MAAGALALLAAVFVLVNPASAQRGGTTCSTAGAVSDAANNPGLVSDCNTLLAARDTLAGTATLNWSVSTPIDQWEGVTVSGSPPRVTELILPEKGLTGEIPAELATLSNLRELSLSSNQLTGQIPTALGGLSNLVVLYLYDNQLTGPIPSELGGLSNLIHLYLSQNQLTGPIPGELGSLANLERLFLFDNELTGSIPAELGNLSDLILLSLRDNNLTGPIPTRTGQPFKSELAIP